MSETTSKGNEVGQTGATITLSDGPHRVFASTLDLIEIEDTFDGFMALLREFATKPVKTVVTVLENCDIDGQRWDRERIAAAMRGVKKLEVATDLQVYLLEEMGYTEETADVDKAKAKLQEMGVDVSKVDPTKPETWMPQDLASLAKPDSTGTA